VNVASRLQSLTRPPRSTPPASSPVPLRSRRCAERNLPLRPLGTVQVQGSLGTRADFRQSTSPRLSKPISPPKKMNPTDNNARIDYLEFWLCGGRRRGQGPFTAPPSTGRFTDYGSGLYEAFTTGRLAGGFFAAPGAPAKASPLVVIFGADLEATEAIVRQSRRQDHQAGRSIFPEAGASTSRIPMGWNWRSGAIERTDGFGKSGSEVGTPAARFRRKQLM